MICELCGVEINKKNREDLDPYEGEGKFSKLNRFKCLDCNTEYRATESSHKIKTGVSVFFVFFSTLFPIFIPNIFNILNVTLQNSQERNIIFSCFAVIGLIQILIVKNIEQFEIVNRKTYHRTDI